MKYKLKRVHLNADDASGVNFPALKDRQIIKTGHEDVFTLNQVEAAQAHYQKTLKELKAQIELDSAKMQNIEHFLALDSAYIFASEHNKHSWTSLLQDSAFP